MKKQHKNAKRNLLIGFGFSTFILILSAVVSYVSLSQLLESQNWVKHTNAVEAGLANLISKMTDAETGQRGYLLTGNDLFLDPYEGSRDAVAEYFNEVRVLTTDNTTQQKDFPRLEQLINEKYKVIDGTIAEKRKGLTVNEATLLRGKQVMDSIRLVIKVMADREKGLMVLRNARMDRFAATTPITIAFGALIAMAITIFFYFKVLKDDQVATSIKQELEDTERRTKKGIDVINDAAKKIAEGDYTVRIDKKEMD